MRIAQESGALKKSVCARGTRRKTEHNQVVREAFGVP